ncbi:ATP-binding protein [Ornithinicoccus halotolerans]|uniref:ATP-binding protein n=1 Tax=Ornithinicoccus halotolerans TaxID=1748220 RepID=UPI0012969C18|nr:ATP-binding protein [Ornithinicoccus halotolerans]
MRAEELRPLSLFDGLSTEQLAQLVDAGEGVAIEPGVELFHEGDRADSWWVLVEGSIELVRHLGREDSVVGALDVPGRWAGGFRAWDEHGIYLATGRGSVPGRVLRVPSAELRRLFDTWFPFGGHLIKGVYGTARSIEATARQRASLVTLGTLAAGLAHELNNPAAAATRSVAALEEAHETLLSSLGRLTGGDTSAEQFSALDDLRREIRPRAAALDPLGFADHEQALSDWLRAHGVERDWAIATPLAAAGVDLDWCERAAAVLHGGDLEPGLEWVASTLSVTSLLGQIRESTGRVSDLVAAVKSYSQMDRGSMQRIDVTDGLESTLVMLGQKLRQGVTLVRSYAQDTPQIEAFPGELNQVWTNLIDNAVDAMDGAGTLHLRVMPEGDTVVVEVGDTGPGMTPQVAARAFEAFYTTKDVGKGTGLGLDIAHRIVVDRHGGQITIRSGPEGTVLRVALPVRAARR